MKNFLSISKNNAISSIAIGKFDGVHLGHQRLINALLDSAESVEFLDSVDSVASADFAKSAKNSAQSSFKSSAKSCPKSNPKSSPKSSLKKSAIIIIDTHSSEFLTSLQDRFERLADFRAQAFVLDLEKVRDFSGEAFVAFLQNLLPNLEKIVVGYDFAFGKNRAFGAEDLRLIFQNKNTQNSKNASNATKSEVIIIPKVSQNGVPLHSSAIKDLIMQGEISRANEMLGWHYAIKGVKIRGQGIGAKEIFPTINLQTNGYVLPANGVYATRTNGLESVSFIGNRLSTDRKFSIETHILGDFATSAMLLESAKSSKHNAHKNSDFGGLRVEFIQKLRPNRHFDTLALLKSQIAQDIANAKEILTKS